MFPPHFEKSDVQTLSQLAITIGAIIGGAWTIYNYTKNRRHNAATWINKLFEDFYIKDTFQNIKKLIQYYYEDIINPTIEKVLTDPCPTLTNDEINILEELDKLLNYFEHVLYLEEQKHLRKIDTEALLDYWFNLMNEKECTSLRQYITKFGYERIQKSLRCSEKVYIALYGTLMHDFNGKAEAGVTDKLGYIGECTIEGKLYDLGDFPGLVQGEDHVRAELYEVLDMSAIKDLDKFEQYDPKNKDNSLYIRKLIRTSGLERDAWVYFYNKDINNAPLIPSGDWRVHKKKLLRL